VVTGYLQPNEIILYRNGEEDPYFVRQSYAFEGLGTPSEPLTAGQIVAIARAADSGTPLPASDAQPDGLPNIPQSKVAVRRYARQTGEARIIVEWGVRGGGGGGGVPALESRSSNVGGTKYRQPFMTLQDFRIDDNVVVGGMPVAGSREITRVRTRVYYRRLVTLTEGLASAIDSAIADHIGKLFYYNGANRILIGGGYAPYTQTQGYVTTIFDRLAPVRGVLKGDIVDYTDPATAAKSESMPVAELVENQVYKVPTKTGTEAEPLANTYEEGILFSLFWLGL
jgi:hypothetical protein